MYIRTTRRTNKDGSVVEYVQLAHNYRDPQTGRPKPQILYNFGRRDRLDEGALLRLVDSISAYLGGRAGADSPKPVRSGAQATDMRFLESRPMGGAWLLRGLWDQLGIDTTLMGLAGSSGVADAAGVEACVWSMVANRALAPCSKHAVVDWLAGSAYLPRSPDWAVP
jgi:hypothetical protein